MIADAAESLVLSTLAWADRGNLVAIPTGGGQAFTIPISARHTLELFPGREDHFSILHANANVTVHRFGDPALAVATVHLEGMQARLKGDAAAFDCVPRHYVVMTEREFGLLSVRDGEASVQRFPWYDDGYDKGHQGIIGATELPATGLLLMSVQRDSRLVVYDPLLQRVVRRVALTGRRGNPQVWVRRNAPELRATDYDTIVKLDVETLSVSDSQRLQAPTGAGVQQFIGSVAFDPAESIAVVARPFGNDVVGLEPSTLRMTHACSFGDGSQPIEALVLRNRKVFARGWKGSVLRGELKERRFYRFFR